MSPETENASLAWNSFNFLLLYGNINWYLIRFSIICRRMRLSTGPLLTTKTSKDAALIRLISETYYVINALKNFFLVKVDEMLFFFLAYAIDVCHLIALCLFRLGIFRFPEYLPITVILKIFHNLNYHIRGLSEKFPIPIWRWQHSSTMWIRILWQVLARVVNAFCSNSANL